MTRTRILVGVVALGALLQQMEAGPKTSVLGPAQSCLLAQPPHGGFKPSSSAIPAQWEAPQRHSGT
jgi:hypothetical protein